MNYFRTKKSFVFSSVVLALTASQAASALDVIDTMNLLKKGRTDDVAARLRQSEVDLKARKEKLEELNKAYEREEREETEAKLNAESEAIKATGARESEQDRVSSQYQGTFSRLFSRVFDTSYVSHLKDTERAALKNKREKLEAFESGVARREAQLNIRRKEIKQTEAELEQAQKQTKQFIDEMMKYDQEQNFRHRFQLSEADARDPKKVYEAFVALNKQNAEQAQMEMLNHQTRKVFDQQKEAGFDAKLLLSKMDNLATQYGLDKLQVDAMKAAIDNQLNDTLLGEYVNKQVSKIGHNFCSLQDECAKASATGTAADLENKISGMLRQSHESSRRIANEVRPKKTGETPRGSGGQQPTNSQQAK